MMESSNMIMDRTYVESKEDEDQHTQYKLIDYQSSANDQNPRQHQVENGNNLQTDSGSKEPNENDGHHYDSFRKDSHYNSYSSYEAYRNTCFKANRGLFDGKNRDYGDTNTSKTYFHTVVYINSFHRTLAFINNTLLLHHILKNISMRLKLFFFTFLVMSVLQPGPYCLYSFAHAKSLSPLLESSENESQHAVDSAGVTDVNMNDFVRGYIVNSEVSDSSQSTEEYTVDSDEYRSKLHTRSVSLEQTTRENDQESHEIDIISVSDVNDSIEELSKGTEEKHISDASDKTSMDKVENNSQETIDNSVGQGYNKDEENEDSKGIIPEYMLKIYQKFTQNHFMHPASDTVRSFSNINDDILFNATAKTELPGAVTRNHTLIFNISSFPKGEQINLAQLRLYKLVERDRNTYAGENRIVSLYEEIIKDDSQHLKLVFQKHIYGRNSGWESFDVTPAVKRWVDEIGNGYVQMLQVTIESIFNKTWGDDMDISTTPRNKKEPLLVVFSKQINKRLVHKLERDDFLHHEMNLRESEDIDNYTASNPSKKSHLKNNNYVYDEEDEDEEEEIEEHEDEDYEIDEYDDEYEDDGTTGNDNVTPEITSYAKVRRSIRSNKSSSTQGEKTRVKRSKKASRRNICKISKLVVDFRNIDGHDWVIAPNKYDANECIGKCYYPLAKHLQPTKHAMIRANLHIQNKKVTRPCCVPIKLKPISLLYRDAATQSFTFKYKYEGMTVSACGCR